MKKAPVPFLAILLFAACTQNTNTETASTETAKTGATAYKYTTEIPVAVTIPNKVETRLGTLTLYLNDFINHCCPHSP